MSRNPDWDELPAGAPRPVIRLLKRCLERDPSARLRDVGDARLELRDALSTSEESDATARTPRRGRARAAWPWAVTGLLAVLLVVQFFLRGNAPVRQTVRAFVPPPAGGAFDRHPVLPGPVAVSPDGERLVFAARSVDGPVQLWVRPVNGFEARALPGTVDAAFPFWSPDGEQIAFFAGGKLKTIAVAGGPVVTVEDVGGAGGGVWMPDGDILLGGSVESGIRRIPAEGGTPVRVASIPELEGVTDYRHPAWLPGGRFLFLARVAPDNSVGSQRIMVGSLHHEPPVELMTSSSPAQFAAGHLWYVADGVLMARPFDPEELAFRGPAVPVADGVSHSGWASWNGVRYFSVSPAGVIAYHTGPPDTRSQLTWYDRHGANLGTVGPPDNQYHVSLSPDGGRSAMQMVNPIDRTWGIWIYNLDTEHKYRFTPDNAANAVPVWSPEGTRIAYSSLRTDTLEVFIRPTAGGESVRLSPNGLAGYGRDDVIAAFPLTWSADARGLVVGAYTDAGPIQLLAVPVGDAGEPFAIRPSNFDTDDAAISPDGRWLAYAALETGVREIYVTDYPAGRRRWQVSSGGGRRPEWNPQGGELFYLTPDNVLTAAEILDRGEAVEVGEITPLFAVRTRKHLVAEPGEYAVAPDGERFLVNRLIEDRLDAPVALIVGWPEEVAPR
jgi:Tol biopolymer transport system component